jgi:Cu(I)/Ag(I) efflux system membrane fusion protein
MIGMFLFGALNAAERKVLFYRNPMDPKVTSPVFMKDSMGMDYIPVYATEEVQKNKELKISPDRQKMLGIQTITVSTKPLTILLRTAGRVASDKDLYVAQQEYLSAKLARSAELTQASEQRLRLAGMTDAEIRELAVSGKPQNGLYLPAPTAWVYLTIYEQDLGAVKPGMTVTLEFPAFPGETFPGKIVGLTPVLDPQTRAVTARVSVSNPDLRLKPEMFANAVIRSELGRSLSVPASAVIRTGKRSVVFVATLKDTFSPREVKLGQKAGSDVVIISGLRAGERVVKSGNFYLDSEATLKGI